MATNLVRNPMPTANASAVSRLVAVDARASWRHALAALVLVIVWIIACYASTAMGMLRTWSNTETFAHGFVVPPIVLWLIWRRRGDLAKMTPRPMLWGLAPFAIAGLAWTFGRLAEVNAIAQLSMTAMIVLAVPVVLGAPIARTLVFPLGFLFFAVPVGDFVLPVLMNWTASFTVAALRASGIPVYREGTMFVIPTGAWSVIEACSGIRYLIASLMVGTLYAYLTYRSNRRRWLFVGFAILVPVVANWVRAYLIVLLGHLSGNRLAVGVDHIIYGWVFFGLVIMLMFWIGGRWREDPLPESVGGSAMKAASTTTTAFARNVPVQALRFWIAAALAMLISVVFPAIQSRFDAADAAGPVQLTAVVPAGGWAIAPGPIAGWRPAFEHASATFDGHLVRGDQEVGLYIAYYRDQDPAHRLVSSTNVLVRSTDPAWRIVAHGSSGKIPFGDDTVTMTTAQIVRGDNERLLAWNLYWIDGRMTANEYLAKLYTAWARLSGGRDDSAVVIVYAHGADDGRVSGASALLRSFIDTQGAAIVAALDATRARR